MVKPAHTNALPAGGHRAFPGGLRGVIEGAIGKPSLCRTISDQYPGSFLSTGFSFAHQARCGKPEIGGSQLPERRRRTALFTTHSEWYQ